MDPLKKLSEAARKELQEFNMPHDVQLARSARLGSKRQQSTRRGRLPRRDTRNVLLRAARKLFRAAGFEGTSMDSIAAMARMSKATAYAHFRSKTALYRAAMQPDAPPCFWPALAPNGSIEETLAGFGRRFLRQVLSPAHVASLRTLALDGDRFRDLGARLLAKAYGQPLRQLEHYLESADTAGRLDPSNPRSAAEHFVGMLLGLAQVSILLGEAEPTSVELDTRVREAIAAFWRAYGALPREARPNRADTLLSR